MFDEHVLNVQDNPRIEQDLICLRVHCTLLKSLGIKSKQLHSLVNLRRILVRFHQLNFCSHRIGVDLEGRIHRLGSVKYNFF